MATVNVSSQCLLSGFTVLPRLRVSPKSRKPLKRYFVLRSKQMERPILFSGEMVRAILDGRKTQTRRVVKFSGPKNITYQSQCHFDFKSVIPCKKGGYVFWDSEYSNHLQEFHDKVYADERNGMQCPYGKPGDYLWVRETWDVRFLEGVNEKQLCFRADMTSIKCPDKFKGELNYNWRPSIFMPRWASRILLEVVSVRVERLKEMKYEDLEREGLSGEVNCAIDSWINLWNSINGKKHPWESNPWVWVVEFKRVEL